MRQNSSIDYTNAADYLNFSNIDVVSLQHEYGIFGGTKGSYILGFLKRLNRPVVTTCHTILEQPTADEREILIIFKCKELLEQLNVVTENGCLFEKQGENQSGEESPRYRCDVY